MKAKWECFGTANPWSNVWELDMKKQRSPLVIVLGIVGVGLCLCCGGGGATMWFGWQKMTGARDEAFAYAEPTLKAMSKDWQPGTTTPYLYRKDLAGELAGYKEKFGELKALGAQAASS